MTLTKKLALGAAIMGLAGIVGSGCYIFNIETQIDNLTENKENYTKKIEYLRGEEEIAGKIGFGSLVVTVLSMSLYGLSKRECCK